MSDKSITVAKLKLLNDLLSLYRSEVEVIFAIGVSWEQLKDEAQIQCAEDFDQAIIARESLMEELADLRDSGIDAGQYEFSLFTVDQHLLDQNKLVKELYGLDVNSFLNVKKPKGLLKGRK